MNRLLNKYKYFKINPISYRQPMEGGKYWRNVLPLTCVSITSQQSSVLTSNVKGQND